MGIALAHIGKIRGYKVVLVVPEAVSVERRVMLRAYGAEVLISNPSEGFPGVLRMVKLLLDKIPNSVWLDQFSNPSNPAAHYRTTGPEIWRQTEGKVDIVCFGVGSGGTITGVGRYLKEKNPEIEMYPVEPYESSVLSGFPSRMHGIQGIGSGTIPENVDRTLFTGIIRVKSEDALIMTRRLANEEAILGGISSGANVVAAVELASRPENAGKLIVTTVNSFAERYFSTELYSNLLEEVSQLKFSSDEEAVIIAERYLNN